MKNVIRKAGGIMMVLVFMTGNLQANKQVEKVIADQRFEVNQDAVVGIDHKFGDVTLKNWNENTVWVNVTAVMKEMSEEKAARLLEKIDVKVEGDREGVYITSNLSDKLFDNGKNKLSVDINVYMPKSLKLDMEHMFGNAFVESVEGHAKISSQYGSIEIVALLGSDNELEIGFSDAEVKYIARGEVDVNYAEVDIKKAENLEINSEFSNVEIGQVDQLEIENEGGQISIGTVNVIEISTKLTDFEIRSLQKALEAETEYGNLNVKGISREFESVSIDNNFGSVNLDFDSGTSFNLNADLEFCSLEYPENMATFTKKVSTTTDSMYEGVFGENKNPKATVKINSGFGGVAIGY